MKSHELKTATNAGLIDIQIEDWAAADLVLDSRNPRQLPSVKLISLRIRSGVWFRDARGGRWRGPGSYRPWASFGSKKAPDATYTRYPDPASVEGTAEGTSDRGQQAGPACDDQRSGKDGAGPPVDTTELRFDLAHDLLNQESADARAGVDGRQNE